MEVQAKINCSLDDLIKLQRKAPWGATGGAAATPQKRAAPQHINNRNAIGKQFNRPGRQQQQQRPFVRQQKQEQPRNHQKQKQQQQNRTLAHKIDLPLDAVIATQQQQNRQQQQKQQQNYLSGFVSVSRKSQILNRRRGGFLTPRNEQRGSRLPAAAAAARAAARSAAAKSLAVAARPKGGRFRTPHQQVVETLKSAATFKPSAPWRSRTNAAFAKGRPMVSFAAPTGRKFGNGRLLLRRQPGAAVGAASRVNTSLARRRPLGSVGVRQNSAAVAFTRSRSFYPVSKQQKAAAVAMKPIPIDRRRAPSPPPPAAPSFAADPEMLANIKIMATLDTVPAPLPQQRGAHVAIPAAMQQQQQQEPSRAVGAAVADAGTLSSRFGY